MVMQIVKEIEEALKHNLYFAALSLALLLPDICGKAEYPSLCTSQRYKKWYDDNLGITEKPPHFEGDPEMPFLNGEVVYSLRCSLLHEGNPDLQKKDNKPPLIDTFSLIIQSEQPFKIYSGDSSCVMTNFDGSVVRSYQVNVRRLCMVLCLCAKAYYEENKEKFNFYTYKLIDWDEVSSQFPKLDMEQIFRDLTKKDDE